MLGMLVVGHGFKTHSIMKFSHNNKRYKYYNSQLIGNEDKVFLSCVILGSFFAIFSQYVNIEFNQ